MNRDAQGRLLPGHKVRGGPGFTSESNPSNGPVEQHPRWAGDAAGRAALHQRVEKVRGKAKQHGCEECGARAREWARIHGRTGLSVHDYRPLCKLCHVAYDRDTLKRKLTPEQVITIRARSAAGARRIDLAAEYGVAAPTISQIVHRKKWRWLP